MAKSKDPRNAASPRPLTPQVSRLATVIRAQTAQRKPGGRSQGDAEGPVAGANGHRRRPLPLVRLTLEAGPGITRSPRGPERKSQGTGRLAQEQGYLTYSDINDALPESVVRAEDLDDIYTQLRNLEVAIVDQAEVDRLNRNMEEEEEERSRLDILDDPVRCT